jgi:DNA-binding NarL/FixJ family response regulator
MIRLIIADDHPLIRAGLKHVIEDQPDIEVVAEVESGAQAIEAAETTETDVMLLDITMPGPGIEEVLTTLRERAPKLSILVLSVHPEEQYAIRLLRAGAAGYLSKQYSGAKLIEAIRKIHGGGRFVSDVIAQRLAKLVSRGEPAVAHETLSRREHQVLTRLAAGRSAREIAQELDLSPKTVATYRSRIRSKLKVESNAELIRYAIQHHLID